MAVHLGSSLLSMSLCPQFGINLFNASGIMTYFMKLGHIGCLAACGVFFMFISVLLSTLLLRLEELVWLSKNKMALGGIMVIFTLTCFWMLSPAVVFQWTTLVWALAGLATLWTGFELAPRFKASYA